MFEKYESHGEFSIALQGQVIIISYLNSWNKEAVQCFFEEYTAFVRRKNLREFATLTNLLHFNGVTPDTLMHFPKITNWAEKNGLLARAFISNHSLFEFMIDQVFQEASTIPTKLFSNRSDGLEWLASLGITIR